MLRMGFTESADGIGSNDLGLSGTAVVAEQLAIRSPAVNDVGIGWIRRDVATLSGAGRVPVTEGDGAIIAAADDEDAAAILLRAVDVIRELVVHGDVIELRRRLVVPAAPAAAAVYAYACPLIAAEDHALRVG